MDLKGEISIDVDSGPLAKVCTLMLRLYLSRSPHFYSDWLWPYCDSCLSILPKNVPNLWLISFLYQIECKCYSSHLKNKERKIKIKLLEVWLITTVTLCQFTSIFTSYCKAYIELHNGAKTLMNYFFIFKFQDLLSKFLIISQQMYRLIIFRVPIVDIYQN